MDHPLVVLTSVRREPHINLGEVSRVILRREFCFYGLRVATKCLGNEMFNSVPSRNWMTAGANFGSKHNKEIFVTYTEHVKRASYLHMPLAYRENSLAGLRAAF